MTERPILTTTAGAPIADNQNSLTAGPRGPLLGGLPAAREARAPEPRANSRAHGARQGMGRIWHAHDHRRHLEIHQGEVLLEAGAKTDMFARFSTVAGELGAADAERDVRGFAIKFYTEEGNWDLVGNNTPVFFVRDPLKFPDFIHTQKRHPKTNLRSTTAMWDFWSLSPESLHQVTILMSDRGLPLGPRFMNGYGSHTYSFWNERGERYWVKFHFKTQQGHRFLTNDEAAKVVGGSRESFGEDLRRDRARRISTLDDASADHAGSRRGKHAVQPVRPDQSVAARRLSADRSGRDGAQPQPGELLQRDRARRLLAVEHRARNRLSPDKMLQARVFSYADAHRHRLGTHYEALPVNAPRCPVHNYHKDGAMRFFPIRRPIPTPTTNRTPSTAPFRTSVFTEPPLKISGNADRYNHRDGNDDYRQPGALFRLIGREAQQRLLDNTAEAMHGIPLEIVRRWAAHCYKADPEYGKGLAARMGLSASDLPSAKAAE